jgi:hypothetical protein
MPLVALTGVSLWPFSEWLFHPQASGCLRRREAAGLAAKE